jgi:hypothetical protein
MIEIEWIKEHTIKKLNSMNLYAYNVQCHINVTDEVIFECDTIDETGKTDHIQDRMPVMKVILAQAVYNLKDNNPYAQ